MAYFLARPVSERTIRKYESVARQYKNFAEERKMDWRNDTSVAEFLAARATRAGIQTLKNEWSAIKNYARITEGFDGLGASEIVDTTLKAIQRNVQLIAAPSPQLPVPAALIEHLLDSANVTQPLIELRHAALVATAFLAMLRADTLMSLRREDVMIDHDGVVCISRVRGVVKEKGRGKQLVRDDPRSGSAQVQRIHWAPATYARLIAMYTEQREWVTPGAMDCAWNIGRADEIAHKKPRDSWAPTRVTRAIRRSIKGTIF